MNSYVRVPSVTVPDWVERHRFDADQYQAMGAAGIFDPQDSVELIDGEILRMSPVGGPHIRVVMNLTRLLVLAAGHEYDVHVQSPIRLGHDSEPEPDIAVLRAGAGGKQPRSPPPGSEAVLLIEVSDTTLRFDREVKRAFYARHEIPELWIIDVNRRTIEVSRAPKDGAYTVAFTNGAGEPVAPIALPGLVISVDMLGV